MKILVVGGGGREHSILWALRKTTGRPLELFCAPGNAGIEQIARCVPIDATHIGELASFSTSEKVDLTIVGPEAPLATGIVDAFENRGLKILGPHSQAARLESSKAFAKDFMRRHNIPTARHRVVSAAGEAIGVLRSGEFGSESTPVVIKADGLAAGKGVVVARSRAEAENAVRELTTGGVSTDAVRKIVIEEALEGPEVSLLLFSDGKDFRLMPAARDHKRLRENDSGPNTGGMGSITDANIVDRSLLDRIVRQIVEPTLAGASIDGFPFSGILFIGLMLTAEGPKVLEYNVRFGDPETQAILVRLQTDLVEIFEAIMAERLGQTQLTWSDESSACVVLAARGYPGRPERNVRIDGLDRAAQGEQVSIFHAATARGSDGEWLTAGGRVLGVTATGENLAAATARCYRAVAEIHWEGMQYRPDIGRQTSRLTTTSA